jgi:hypothetical protein
MTDMPIELAGQASAPERSKAPVPDDTMSALRVVGSVLRLVFIACLVAITVRVAMPQNETIWTVYDSPGDLVRMILGLGVCFWVGVQLFRWPKDAKSHQTWLYFGLAAVPFALICLIAVWR